MKINDAINDRKIKIALVGCGRISKNHFTAILQHQQFLELVAVCDNDLHRLNVAAMEQSVPGYSSIQQLLLEVNADLIILCTPSGLHAKQACLCAHFGKHVVTEKPMATRWQDGLQMVNACEQAGVRLFVVKQNRFNPTVKAVKKAIDEGRFGRLYMVHSNVFWARGQDYYDQDKWRGTVEFDGGAFMNQASHYVDLLEWLVGPVQSVHAMQATLARRIEVEDTGVLNLRWRSGTIGSMSVTMLTYPKNLEGSITIIGEKGTIKLGGVALNKIEHWEFADAKNGAEYIMALNYDADSVYGQGHIDYYQNVIDVLHGKAEPQTDGRDGLRSLELLVASNLSARGDKTVHLPLSLEL